MPTARVDVDDRAFLAGLRAALTDMKLEAIGSIERTSDRIVVRAEQLAPVRTGALKADINAHPFAREGRGGFILITAGTREAFYQEFGTSKMRAHPFLRPAMAEAAGSLRGIGIAARLASTPAAKAAFRRARQRQRVRRAVLRVRRRPSQQATSLLLAEQFQLSVLERQARQRTRAARRRRRGL